MSTIHIPDGLPQPDRLFVSDDRCTFVRIWSNGTVEVATRETPAHTWGPPVLLTEERPFAPDEKVEC